eukprot:TRINITY_DN55419_c0_g1_i1.p1 TRINITY_DN55419_c0_g1~~TRINITY_DN55419_c0_g1_i1.p1  ORF type:complete len:681 (-),score=187.17 TRINITY_DN55419_c0_g1_i1:87-2129(-)
MAAAAADDELPTSLFGADEEQKQQSPKRPRSVSASGEQPMDVDAGADAKGNESEDEVVQECDVYLNRMYDPPDFVGDLYVLQHPLRPIYRPYGDQGDLERCDLQEQSRRLRFAYKLKQNLNYDDDGAVDDGSASQRHVLSSTVVTNPSCSYAIGVLHQGRLVITPVRAINTMRTDFEHVDRQAARRARGASANPAAAAAQSLGAEDEGGRPRANSGANSDASDADGTLATADQNNMLTAVRVDYTGQAKSSTAEAPREEPWTKLRYYSNTSTEAKDIFLNNMMWPAIAAAEAQASAETEEDMAETSLHPKLQTLELNGDKESFLKAMCGQTDPQKERLKAKKTEDEPDSVLSAYVLSRMPVERQVEAICRHLGVISYSKHLRKRLPPGTMRTHGLDTTLIGLLKRCAVLVCGNWILKTELANYDGAEAYARDMLLMLFHKRNGMLSRDDYLKWVHVFNGPTQATAREEMTRQVAERVNANDPQKETWRLKLPVDHDFVRKFPELAAEFDKWWEQRRGEITAQLSVIKGSKAGGGSTASALASAAARQRASMLVEARALLTGSGMTIGELKRHIQKKTPNIAIREDELLKALQEANDLVQVRNLWILGSTGNDANDKFRTVLMHLFRSRDSVSRPEILAEYEKMHGSQCRLGDYVMRALLREISERADGDNFVMKGALVRQ